MSLEINRAALFGCWLHFSLRGLYTDSARLSVRYALARSYCNPGPRSLKAASQSDELIGYCFKAFDIALLSPGKMTRKITKLLTFGLAGITDRQSRDRRAGYICAYS